MYRLIPITNLLTILDCPIVQREYVTDVHSTRFLLYSLFEDALSVCEYVNSKSE